MNNIDSLSLKYFYEENKDFINGAIVQKIQQIGRDQIILNIRNIDKKSQKKFYININPKYQHICFIDDKGIYKRNIIIPSKPPAFCMQLRKYLNGSKIKDFKLIKYERILEFYFDYVDEIGSITSLCLTIELMGKHSNVILYNASSKIILGSIHNISQDKSSIRVVYGGAKYIYPPLKNKLDILNCSYSTFFELYKDKDNLSSNFYYLSKTLLDFILNKQNDCNVLFSFLQELQSGGNKDLIIEYFKGKDNINSSFDNYYSQIMFDDILNHKKIELKKYLSKEYKRLKKNVSFPPDIKKEEKYKLFGDLIMANLYNNKDYCKFLSVDNQKIELDDTLTLIQNANKYYALYKKEKTTNEYKLIRYNQARQKLEYFENIILSIELAQSYEEMEEIRNEIIELKLINDKKAKVESKLNKIDYLGFGIYFGKNNKQNDYLVSKIAKQDDIWFHGYNFASSHVILKVPNNKKEPKKEVLEFCARLVKQNSKAKNSGKTSIIYTKAKNLKKPPNTYLGYVTYKNEKEIVID